mgnify:CR=1 FL=1
MLQYFVKRLAWLIPTLLGVLFFTFSLIYFLPGDPASTMLGPRATPEIIKALQARLGLDKPVWVSFGKYVWGIITKGDLGESVWSHQPIYSLLLQALPYTIILAASSMVIAIIIGMILGILASAHEGSVLDSIITGFSLIATSIPNFVAACLLLLFFSVFLKLFPVIGAGEKGNILSQLHHLILPSFSLAISWIGYIAYLIRSTMLEVLDSDYIMTAKSFGIPMRCIAYKYALKNAIKPVVAVIGLGLGTLLGGAVFVEVIFNRPGLGKTIADAVFARDIPVVQGGVLLTAFLYVLSNLVADLSYAYFDPRIQYK